MSDRGSVWGNGWGPPPPVPGPAEPSSAADGARIGELLESAIALARRGGRLLVGGVVAIAAVSVAVEAVVVWLLARSVEIDLEGATLRLRDLVDLTWRSIGIGATALATSWLVWVTASALAAAVQEVAGERLERAKVIARLRQSAGPLVRLLLVAWGCAAVLVGLAVGPAAVAARWGSAASLAALVLGVVAAAVIALAVIPRLALAPVAVITESAGTSAAMRHAWRVSGGHYLRVAAVLILNIVVTHAVAAVLAAPVGAFEVQSGYAPPSIDAPLLIAGGAAGALAVIVTAPFTASLLAVCYADLRRRDRRT